jgi:DNA repair protein RadC
LEKIAQASLEELRSIRGIGVAKAARIKAAFEIGRCFYNQALSYKRKDLNSPENFFS